MVLKSFKFSMENVLKKYGKFFLKMCGNPVGRMYSSSLEVKVV